MILPISASKVARTIGVSHQHLAYSSMSIAVLITVTKRWKQFKYTLKHEWIDKMSRTHSVICSGSDRNAILKNTSIWMDFEDMISRITQSQGQILTFH
jgi:hypothetical protein